MGKYSIDMEQYKKLARTAAAEGCVLLKNDHQTLPIRKGEKVAVFGRWLKMICICVYLIQQQIRKWIM